MTRIPDDTVQFFHYTRLMTNVLDRSVGYVYDLCLDRFLVYWVVFVVVVFCYHCLLVWFADEIK